MDGSEDHLFLATVCACLDGHFQQCNCDSVSCHKARIIAVYSKNITWLQRPASLQWIAALTPLEHLWVEVEKAVMQCSHFCMMQHSCTTHPAKTATRIVYN